jgi:general stress protein YciG
VPALGEAPAEVADDLGERGRVQQRAEGLTLGRGELGHARSIRVRILAPFKWFTHQEPGQPVRGGGGRMPETTKMSRAEAGRKGGQTTKRRYGDDFFGKIGRMGGKKGGETTKQRYGIEFYQKIGRKGGSR